ncbi:hypothetical protein BU24DRAFT_393483 [Aaosphaeria arxii CBS 175.79]|uniref:Uncharacterized protein n=1 Tax=Aaosphaeria arxii CBS 175.79 TaxID=1450172 RepID=A0A6A5XR42_9PLEO|nr:uncharacterized protein BU24DRAFT_393483 [Aaosphaeria arxii CBS 175.79]KAF2015170.1 hypothetical protein BU24DRAFT_393483 [Aaosphaeria arxii CBS 175.79]
MSKSVLGCVALIGLVNSVQAQGRSTSEAVKVKWLEDAPKYNGGVTFGLPWALGQFSANASTFSASSGNGDVQLQSWINAYWPDGSIKWTGHALGASESASDEYTITATGSGTGNATRLRKRAINDTNVIQVTQTADNIRVNTGKITAEFPKSGDSILSSIKTSSGKTVGTNGRLVLRSQSGVGDDDSGDAAAVDYYNFISKVSNVTVSKETSIRTLVTVQGIHRLEEKLSGTHKDWLPFTVRFYLYANSEAIRIVHTIIYDGESKNDFISGLGVKFDVPLEGEEFYDRHVRIAGVDGGILHEAVQGLSGLRRDPGKNVTDAQYEGKKLPDISTWPANVRTRTQWIPTWSDYRLTQLSPDGFNIQKRTKAGQSWLKIPGGTRAGGLAYLGGATVGGLAVGLRDFWKKYPTSLDISNAATDTGSITLWLYSPSAEPLDVRPYHDGLGEDTYAKQLDALEITYEDWEGGYDTPYGVARTNELYIYAFDSTPTAEKLSQLTNNTNEPPALVADSAYIAETKALGTYWATPESTVGSAKAEALESQLDFLVKFYEGQVEQRRWYGFWDHGDIMHTYDRVRHQWSYDVGGYAWDNSELSPDLFFWNFFLRTGRADVFRLAEAQARHGGEVDSYHLGNFTGLGTRHGVQHWSDSAKQARISTPIYRKAFFYLSGGDERTGDLIHAVLEAEKAFVLVDARRKVRDPSIIYTPDPEALFLNFGTDWGSIAAAYLIEWERRGPRWEECRDKLINTFKTFPKLKNGFVTGEALYNSLDGTWAPPPNDPDNAGTVTVSHLSSVFGVVETIDELITHYPSVPQPFVDAWLDYCYYYGAPKAEQKARYGKDFGNLNLKQGHSRLTAYAARARQNATLAARAWNEFYTSTDGLSPNASWQTVRIDGDKSLTVVDEADWISTNAAALYGLSAIENLAIIGAADKINLNVTGSA